MNTRASFLAFTLASTSALAQSAHDAVPVIKSQSAYPAAARIATLDPAAQARDIVAFWEAAGPARWFAKDPEFDRRFRERYLFLYERAARGELASWAQTPDGALALTLLLDQFPRNSFRGTARMYATDELAREVASAAIAAGFDQAPPLAMQKFFVLPFAHSERLADQDRSVELAKHLTPEDLAHAQHHREIIRRFGRFPHRNSILGRPSTEAEKQYLANGGYAG